MRAITLTKQTPDADLRAIYGDCRITRIDAEGVAIERRGLWFVVKWGAEVKI